jgi:hypothetical protein
MGQDLSGWEYPESSRRFGFHSHLSRTVAVGTAQRGRVCPPPLMVSLQMTKGPGLQTSRRHRGASIEAVAAVGGARSPMIQSKL